jgi:hypothetical protein
MIFIPMKVGIHTNQIDMTLQKLFTFKGVNQWFGTKPAEVIGL